MAEYKGGSAEGARQHLLEKRRNQMLEDYQKQKMQIAKVIFFIIYELE